MSYNPPRPGSVITAGVLMFVYGTLMLTCNLSCSGLALANQDDPVNQQLIQELPSYAYIKVVAMLLGFVVSGAMILLGVGVLRLMPMARIVTIILCVVDLAETLIVGIYDIVFLFPVNERVIAQNQPPGVAEMTTGLLWFILLANLVVVVTFCALILMFLNLPSARAAFAGEYQPERPRRDRRDRYEDYEDDDDYSPPAKPEAPPDTGIRG